MCIAFMSTIWPMSIFGLEQETVYDALVVAPSYSPDKILKDARFPGHRVGVEELLHRLSGGKGRAENRMD